MKIHEYSKWTNSEIMLYEINDLDILSNKINLSEKQRE